MNKIFKAISFLAVLAIFTSACGAQAVQAATNNLPYGLTMQDTMASVEQKLGQPNVVYAPQAGWEAGMPDESGSPDHTHYWAIYERFGLTIIYNTPSASDKSATIHDILVNE